MNMNKLINKEAQNWSQGMYQIQLQGSQETFNVKWIKK